MPIPTLPPMLLHRLHELQQRCAKQQIITHTDFLDAETVALIQNATGQFASTEMFFSGGFAGAERQVCFFLPYWQNPADFDPEEYIKVLKIIPAASQKLTHRDYLGSLMALGIQREKLGDILLLPDFAELLLFPSILPYLTANLTRIGSTSAQTKEIPLENLQIPPKEFSSCTYTVQSLRCDSILAVAFGLSRTQAVELIHKGLVSVNHLPESKPEHLLTSGCLLSIRGQGRVHMETEKTISRKGRIFIQILREK